MANSPLEDSSVGLQLMLILQVDCSQLFLSLLFWLFSSTRHQQLMVLESRFYFKLIYSWAEAGTSQLHSLWHMYFSNLQYSNFIIQYILLLLEEYYYEVLSKKNSCFMSPWNRCSLCFTYILQNLYIFMAFSSCCITSWYASYNLYQYTAKTDNGYQVKITGINSFSLQGQNI